MAVIRLPAAIQLLSSTICLLVILNGDAWLPRFPSMLVFVHRLSSLVPDVICFCTHAWAHGSLSAASHVESARTSGSFHWYNGLFVFGDSFADTGNFPKANLSQVTRQWYKPYGSSHGLLQDPTGRFSNGFVQSDFIGIYNI